LEEPDRDRDGDERGHEHAGEEDRRELEAQGAQHGRPYETFAAFGSVETL
jgi:hypothetical protein